MFTEEEFPTLPSSPVKKSSSKGKRVMPRSPATTPSRISRFSIGASSASKERKRTNRVKVVDLISPSSTRGAIPEQYKPQVTEEGAWVNKPTTKSTILVNSPLALFRAGNTAEEQRQRTTNPTHAEAFTAALRAKVSARTHSTVVIVPKVSRKLPPDVFDEGGVKPNFSLVADTEGDTQRTSGAKVSRKSAAATAYAAASNNIYSPARVTGAQERNTARSG